MLDTEGIDLSRRRVRTRDAARLIGRTQLRVRQMIQEGKLVGVRRRRDWMVDEQSLMDYLEQRDNGGENGD